jgi:hypothetical protein
MQSARDEVQAARAIRALSGIVAVTARRQGGGGVRSDDARPFVARRARAVTCWKHRN